MAKKGQKVVLENVELQPQVIGLTYRKKSNLGRVVFLFIALGLAIYYINDISLFINNLLGRQTAETIKPTENPSVPGGATGDEDEEENPGEEIKINYQELNTMLEIKEAGLTINRFVNANNNLSFVAKNTTDSNIDLTSSRYFLETYNSEKTLLERFKVDFDSIGSNKEVSFNFNLTNSNITYIALVKKVPSDYPTFTGNETGSFILTCVKDNNSIAYNFLKDELVSISETISNSNITAPDYQTNYSSMQTKVNNYNSIDGITATFNGSINGYTAVFNVDLKTANISSLNEKHYFKNLEKISVINFEMGTYGYTCK